LQKLNAPQENDDKLRELDGMFDDVKSVFDSTVFRLVGVVKLKEVLEDLEIVEDAVISQEMHHVLVDEAQFFFFVLLLVF
jgi:flagellar biosynthesis regulator FlbT